MCVQLLDIEIIFRAVEVLAESGARPRIAIPRAEIEIKRVDDRTDKAVKEQPLVNRLVVVDAEVRLVCGARRRSEEPPGPNGISPRSEFVFVKLFKLNTGLGVNK